MLRRFQGALLAVIFLVAGCASDRVTIVDLIERGFTMTSDVREADFIVTVAYEVPQVIKDADIYYFKRYQDRVTAYADGKKVHNFSRSLVGQIKCRDGVAQGAEVSGCNSSSSADASNDGIHIHLSLDWGGKRSGHLDKTVLVPWTELPKTVKEGTLVMKITVDWQKHQAD